MEHIVQEGINTKKKKQSGGIFEDLMKTLSKQEKQRLLNRTLLDPLASSFSGRAPNGNFRGNICSEDDLRSRTFGAFVVKLLAFLPLLGFSNIYKMV